MLIIDIGLEVIALLSVECARIRASGIAIATAATARCAVPYGVAGFLETMPGFQRALGNQSHEVQLLS